MLKVNNSHDLVLKNTNHVHSRSSNVTKILNAIINVWLKQWVVDSEEAFVADMASLVRRVDTWGFHVRLSSSVIPKYFTLVEMDIFWLLSRKFSFLYIVLYLGLNMMISVLLVFRLILLDLSQCTRFVRSWLTY